MVTNEPLERIQRQFRRQAAAYEQLAATSDVEALRRLASVARVTPDERVLDVACGPAFLTQVFAEAGREAVGIDGTDVFLQHARAGSRRRGLANVWFVLGDVERMPLVDACFDVTSCRAAFHHFPRPEVVLREMARVTRRGGRLLIADMLTSDDAAKAVLHNEIERLCDPTHARALTAAEFGDLFRSCGLTVAFEGRSRIDYAVREWLAHGGPAPQEAREIERRMRASMDGDRADLRVRVEDGELRFSHAVAAFLLVKP